jgi:hypothetical protein
MTAYARSQTRDLSVRTIKAWLAWHIDQGCAEEGYTDARGRFDAFGQMLLAQDNLDQTLHAAFELRELCAERAVSERHRTDGNASKTLSLLEDTEWRISCLLGELVEHAIRPAENVSPIERLLDFSVSQIKRLGEQITLRDLAPYLECRSSGPSTWSDYWRCKPPLQRLCERSIAHQLGEIAPDYVESSSSTKLRAIMVALWEFRDEHCGALVAPTVEENCGRRISVKQLLARQRAARLLRALSAEQFKSVRAAFNRLDEADTLDHPQVGCAAGSAKLNPVGLLLASQPAGAAEQALAGGEYGRVAQALAWILFREDCLRSPRETRLRLSGIDGPQRFKRQPIS